MNWAMSYSSNTVETFSRPHAPVLLHESINVLKPECGACFIDATLGYGGHSELILKRLRSDGRLIAFDADPWAIAASRQRLADYPNIHFVNANFSRLKLELARLDLFSIDGILFDLGVSSPMLDEADRGFSYMNDSPLDMRMDPRLSLTAAEIIARFDEDELKELFFQYGEEHNSKAIARAIIKHRREKPLEKSRELAEILRPYSPPKHYHKMLSRIFQALRIKVNDELNVLKMALEQALELCKPGGRIVVISYHSLEDRIVKQFFTDACRGCICPPESPICTCQNEAQAKWIQKKPARASADEQNHNSRSRSAKLRAIEKR